MAPFDVSVWSSWVSYLVFFLIGLGFGATLEMSGFGDSRRLAAQFYLRDMTVLKVMFTGIITAGTLIFLSTAMGWLEFDRVWVNHTYLFPGIVGGLIMGVGFIIGGFCPGTSIVATSTLKIDGAVFAFGVGFGIFLFSETVHLFEDFWTSSYMGRFTIGDWLGVDAGVALVLVVLMALVMFYGGEIAERFFGQNIPWKNIRLLPSSTPKIAAASALVVVALIVAGMGQPTLADRWKRVAKKAEKQLAERSVYVHPGEVVELSSNASMYVTVLDIRNESDFNLFHIMSARRVDLERTADPEFLRSLTKLPDNNVTFVISNGEKNATAAWKNFVAFGLANTYIVEGGYNKWLEVYPPDECVTSKREKRPGDTEESLQYAFLQAVGARDYAAHPSCACKEYPTDCFLASHPELPQRPTIRHNPHVPKIEYERKVKIKAKKKISGGCG